MTEKEKKDKKMGMITSGVFHGLLVLLFLVLVAWREPNPPLPEYGIELNLGFEEAGSGDTQSEDSAEEESTEEDTPDAEEEADDIQEDVVEAEPAEEVVEPKEEVQDPEPVTEEKVAEITEESEEVVVTQEESSDVKVEEKKEEAKEEVKEEIVTPPVEETKEEIIPPPDPIVDSRALMGGKKSDSKSDSASKSEGTDTNKIGNEGDPEGNVDTQGLNAGGGNEGAVLAMDGWTWNTIPKPDDTSQISGKIVFKITIDDSGRVLNVTAQAGTTVSNELQQVYKKEVQKVTFKRKGNNTSTAQRYEGIITFIIKTN